MTDSDDIQRNQLLKIDTRGRVRSTPQQRDAVLDAYESSGLSGPEFSRVHGINYQTFATWRQKRREQREGKGAGPSTAQQSITLVEATPSEHPARCLRIELPGGVRLEINSGHQTRLAAQLLAELATTQAGGDRC
jgi:transposase-like protein